MDAAAAEDPTLVGRERELSLVAAFLQAAEPARAMVLEGPAGIGKTTVWEAALERARLSGRRVLCTRAAESELRLSFVGVADLLAETEIESLGGVPAPQRRALEIAVLRSAPEDAAADPLAAFAGLRSVLAALAATGPLLIAIDDVSWLDRTSSEALAFVARRIRSQEVLFLMTRRPGSESLLERAFAPMEVRYLRVGGLSLGATRLLLSKRFGLNPPRRTLRGLLDTAAGNPLVMLLLARQMSTAPDWEWGADQRVADLFDQTVESLAGPVRRALLAVAVSGELSVPELTRVVGTGDLEAARSLGVLAVHNGRVRPEHPLLCAAVQRLAGDEERRAVHLALASTVDSSIRRLRHAALGTAATDEELAALLTEAAAAAIRRGDVHDAIELGEHALRLTKREQPAWTQRLLALSEYLVIAGEQQAVADLLSDAIGDMAARRDRARAHLLLGAAMPLAGHERHLDLALLECDGEPDLRVAALAAKSILMALVRVARIADAEVLAREGVQTSGATADVQQRAQHALAWASVLRGSVIDSSVTRDEDTNGGSSLYETAIERPTAVQLMWRGELEQARAVLARLLTVADHRGEARSCLVLQLHLCELELRAGDTHAAGERLDDLDTWTASEADIDVATLGARCRALLAAVRGERAETERWAAAALSGSEQSGFTWDRLEALRARGVAALGARDPAAAAENLRTVWDYTRKEGIDDPGAFPVGPDLVEALLETGDLDGASEVADVLRALARAQRHPWALASVIRCDALLSINSASSVEAVRQMTEAAARYATLGLRFDQARTLLTAGRAARRLRKWNRARQLIEEALALFLELGAVGWVAAAREELDRVGGRSRTPSGELTSAERRVASLAAEGLSNKEIARRLVVSVSTVETHLRHVYAKMGVRTRTQLGRRLTPGA